VPNVSYFIIISLEGFIRLPVFSVTLDPASPNEGMERLISFFHLTFAQDRQTPGHLDILAKRKKTGACPVPALLHIPGEVRKHVPVIRRFLCLWKEGGFAIFECRRCVTRKDSGKRGIRGLGKGPEISVKRSFVEYPDKTGAGYGIRTRDFQLGKL
jgi:hypothetical protein